METVWVMRPWHIGYRNQAMMGIGITVGTAMTSVNMLAANARYVFSPIKADTEVSSVGLTCLWPGNGWDASGSVRFHSRASVVVLRSTVALGASGWVIGGWVWPAFVHQLYGGGLGLT